MASDWALDPRMLAFPITKPPPTRWEDVSCVHGRCSRHWGLIRGLIVSYDNSNTALVHSNHHTPSDECIVLMWLLDTSYRLIPERSSGGDCVLSCRTAVYCVRVPVGILI